MVRGPFELFFAVALLVLVVAGFSSRALFLPEYLPPLRATLLIHIVVTGFWFFLLIAQSYLIGRNNYGLHHAFGWFGVIVALLVVASGTTMIVELNRREFSLIQIIVNAVNLITFTIFVTAGTLRRKRRAFHRRMMLFASISLMTPALARLFQPLGAEALALPSWLALIATVAIFDYVKQQRITGTTWFGISVSLFFLVAQTASIVVWAPAEVA